MLCHQKNLNFLFHGDLTSFFCLQPLNLVRLCNCGFVIFIISFYFFFLIYIKTKFFSLIVEILNIIFLLLNLLASKKTISFPLSSFSKNYFLHNLILCVFYTFLKCFLSSFSKIHFYFIFSETLRFCLFSSLFWRCPHIFFDAKLFFFDSKDDF